MMPVGPLMIEHRLIERMIRLLKDRAQTFAKKNTADTDFIERAVDFIKTYADRCHHGKEEDILFHELKKKSLSPEHKKILDELVQEHFYARTLTKELTAAGQAYAKGNKALLSQILKFMNELAEFYPKHIEKEDKHFFLPCMNYFSDAEQGAMLGQFWDFDKKLIHEKYRLIVSEAEKAK